MKNFVQDGSTVTWTNTTGSTVSSGAFVAVGALIGVAMGDIANNATGTLAVEGVFSGAPKTTGVAWSVGSNLLWDASAGKFATTATLATGDVSNAAIAWAAAASGDTTGTVKLNVGATVT